MRHQMLRPHETYKSIKMMRVPDGDSASRRILFLGAGAWSSSSSSSVSWASALGIRGDRGETCA